MEAELPMFKKGAWRLGRPGTTHEQMDALPPSSLPIWGLQADSEGSFPTSQAQASQEMVWFFFFFPPRPSEAESLKGP